MDCELTELYAQRAAAHDNVGRAQARRIEMLKSICLTLIAALVFCSIGEAHRLTGTWGNNTENHLPVAPPFFKQLNRFDENLVPDGVNADDIPGGLEFQWNVNEGVKKLRHDTRTLAHITDGSEAWVHLRDLVSVGMNHDRHANFKPDRNMGLKITGGADKDFFVMSTAMGRFNGVGFVEWRNTPYRSTHRANSGHWDFHIEITATTKLSKWQANYKDANGLTEIGKLHRVRVTQAFAVFLDDQNRVVVGAPAAIRHNKDSLATSWGKIKMRR